jgi:sporulation protein YabP
MNDQITADRHDVSIKGRKHIDITGVREVLSFDETLVRLVTSCGVLNLEGEGLRVRTLDLGSGTVAVTGQLNGVLYEIPPSEEPAPRGRGRGRGIFR